ncbi:single-stranded DNA-binding protein [Halobacteriovorax sp. RZ-2]|uniref:single-stranded DNA-binding protein n=1 Tax=unclassified Halobacteriovorax TaxID=2639665 RepID=UPI003722DC21
MENTYETFIGRLGRNPELKYTKERKPVCHLSVAIYKGKDNPPHWRKVTVWDEQAELCNLYLKKGYEVFVQGRAETKSFKTVDGDMKSYEEVNARLVGFTNLN